MGKSPSIAHIVTAHPMYEAGNFEKHLRTHTGKTPTNATNAIMHPFNHTNNLRTHLKMYIGSNRNATNVTMHAMIL